MKNKDSLKIIALYEMLSKDDEQSGKATASQIKILFVKDNFAEKANLHISPYSATTQTA